LVTLKIKKVNKNSKIPSYAHKFDAGLDLYSSINCVLKPFKRLKVPTGIKVSIPIGYAGFIQPKSGLAINHGIALVNSPANRFRIQG